MPHTIRSITELVEGKLIGPGDAEITGVEQVQLAQPGQLTFIGDDKYADRWERSDASGALVTRGVEVAPRDGKAIIFVDNADLAMAKVLELFAPPAPLPPPGIHPTAIIDPTADVGTDCRIGPYCVIGPRAVIGDGCVMHGHVMVMQETRLGRGCTLWPGAVVRDRCILGDRCILHPNAVIGADGFGYRPGQTPTGPGLVKVPQIGIVRMGNDVEIGAGSCVDRAKFSATFIDDGVKIDNLVQIGHNCRIGKSVVIAGCTAVAGSVTIGDFAMIGGMVAIKDHVKLGRGAKLTGGAQLMHDIPDGETWAGSPAMPIKQAARQVLAVSKLPDLVKRLKSR
jgi:UDP-3-O-[3-hydroxymyristoyl] glucosamine N-acyltransferase